MKLAMTVALAATILLGAPASAQADLDRAIRNYLAVVEGRARLQDLTPAEQAEVAEIARRLDDPQSRASPEDRCLKEAMRRRGAEPSELERRLIDLRCTPALR